MRIVILSLIYGLLSTLLWACTPAKDPNSLTFSTWGSPEEMAILKPLLKEFEQLHPEIKLNVLHIPDKYFQKIHALLAANIAPDVIFLNNINFPVYASNEAFLNVEPYLQKSQVLKTQDFYPQTLEGFRWNGQLQGIPRDASNLVVFYNKTLFDKAGVPYPKANWTYDEMVATAKKLTLDANRDGHPEQFGMSFQDHFLFWFPYVWSFGGDLVSADRKQFTLNQEKALDGLQKVADLRHKHHVAPTASEAGTLKMSQMFMQSSLAMVLNGRWAVPLYRQNLKFDWDIVPFPAGPAGSIVDADASGWVIAKNAANPDKAWQLVEFLSSKKAAEAFTKPGLIIPARKDVAESDVFMSPGLPPQHARVFLDVLANGKPMPAIPYWNAVIDTLGQSLEPVWEGKKTAKEAMQGVDAKVQALL